MTEVQIPAGRAVLSGNLTIPQNAMALVLFAHGSGSSRHSPRNQFVARTINRAGLGTLLFDLLTPEEEALDIYTREPQAKNLATALFWTVSNKSSGRRTAFRTRTAQNSPPHSTRAGLLMFSQGHRAKH